MPRFLIQLDNKFLEWSTVVDAPVTYGMTEEEFRVHYQDQYGRASLQELEDRLARVKQTGTSSKDGTPVDEMISWNRAGRNETCLSKEQLIDYYVRNPPAAGEREKPLPRGTKRTHDEG